MSQTDDRTPPTRVRITGLQEAQLSELQQSDALCSEMYYALGFDAAEVPVRSAADIALLTRHHNILVAEADHVAVGLLAWRDEAPGIAYLAEIFVHPDYQRFGIGAKLLAAMRDDARGLRLEYMTVRCWEKATWALSFYERSGFARLSASVPPKVHTWQEERSAGRPLTRPGEIALWSFVGAATPVEDMVENDGETTEVDPVPPYFSD